MKRFTMTPQPKKSIKTQQSISKQVSAPRMSIVFEDLSSQRNIRDKIYKQTCCDKIMKFLIENNYDGLNNIKSLNNPSNKDFQNIFKFLYSFIDPTPFIKFEEDVMNVLKLLKYPFISEITRSQLAAITPHTWPVLLSMTAWMVELVIKSDEKTDSTSTVEAEFFDFVCEGYTKFMEGIEDEQFLEDNFISKVSSLHYQENADLENRNKEISVLKDELQNIKKKFKDLDKFLEKKRAVEEDLNQLILHEKPIDSKKIKYMKAIADITDEIQLIDKELDNLFTSKSELLDQISKQTINPDDIKGMNIEKMDLFKELERLKPERENLNRVSKENDQIIAERLDENEKILNDLLYLKRDVEVSKDLDGNRYIDRKIIEELEEKIIFKKESIVNYEISIATLDEKVNDKSLVYKDLESQYSYYSNKLQTIGSIYLEKKEISDRSQQKTRSEMDKLDNELLKLKLDSDSAYLKSEKEYSEAKIQMDVLSANIEKEKESIHKTIWNFYTNLDSSLKTIDIIGQELKKISATLK